MDISPNLALPFVAAAQSQKHVTVNEALGALDVLAQIAVETRTATAPPAAIEEGARYLVPDGATGEWAGRDGMLAALSNGWRFHAPADGWLVWIADEELLLVRAADRWRAVGGGVDSLERLGINATADGDNRLAVAGTATLLTHEGEDHRLTINKATAEDTASVVFQTGYESRAEFGLAGEDAWSVKVTPDGDTWRTALRVDPSSGVVTMPERPHAVAALDAGAWRVHAEGALSGFDTLAVGHGFTLGDHVSQDASDGRFLVAQAGGPHQVSIRIYGDPDLTFRLYLRVEPSGARPLFVQCSTAPRQPWIQEVATLVDLEPGDRLALEFREAGRCYHAVGRTELMVLRL